MYLKLIFKMPFRITNILVSHQIFNFSLTKNAMSNHQTQNTLYECEQKRNAFERKMDLNVCTKAEEFLATFANEST